MCPITDVTINTANFVIIKINTRNTKPISYVMSCIVRFEANLMGQKCKFYNSWFHIAG